ncbi:MAG: hypothetical protein K1X89_18015 [Myxococcaceae bacterium]|nr:hypothetical protein [Myxococcaceae bacterium]
MKLLLVVAGFSVLSGCSGHYLNGVARSHELARAGEVDQALGEFHAVTDGQGWDALLVALDEGELLHQKGDLRGSTVALNRAAQLAEERETVSVSEEFLGKAPFRMASHEKQALHALQALNYLSLGELDEAVVEARLTDLSQEKLADEAAAAAKRERFLSGGTLRESQRPFFEQLAFGRYVAGLAYELRGDREAAFIDYWRAFELSSSAPADARVSPAALAPVLLKLGRALGRPEVAEVERRFPGVQPAGDAELVVIVEAGFGPVITATELGMQLDPRPRAPMPDWVVVDGEPRLPSPMSSLEELALRRRHAGVVLDRERTASIGVNTAMVALVFPLFPVMAPLAMKRSYEGAVRLMQSWELLPAEFGVVRLSLMPGAHAVSVPTLRGLEARTVEVKPGVPTVLVTRAP